jgi:hypothetical protein
MMGDTTSFGLRENCAREGVKGAWLCLLADLAPELRPAVLAYPQTAPCSLGDECRMVSISLDEYGEAWVKMQGRDGVTLTTYLMTTRDLTKDEVTSQLLSWGERRYGHLSVSSEETSEDRFWAPNAFGCDPRGSTANEEEHQLALLGAFVHGHWGEVFKELCPELAEAVNKAPQPVYVSCASRSGMFRFDPYFNFNGRAFHKELTLSRELVISYIRGCSRRDTIRKLAEWVCRQPDEICSDFARKCAHKVLAALVERDEEPPWGWSASVLQPEPPETPILYEGPWPFEEVK